MSTASLCCAALAAAAPSARGGERRLPGLRAAAGSPAGFRGVAFTTLSMGKAAPPPPKPKVTMLACAKATKDSAGNTGDFEDSEEYFDLFYAAISKEIESKLDTFELLDVELSEEEKAVQKNLKEIAERCMDLQVDAIRRLRPKQRRPLYPMVRTVHIAFASVKLRGNEGRADLGQASLLLVEKLDMVRRMVSCACSAPLPLDWKVCFLPPLLEDPGFPAYKTTFPAEVVPFALIEYTYNSVKSDIDRMIAAAGDATSTSS